MNQSGNLEILIIKGVISDLPAAQAEACNELADHIRRAVVTAGEPVGTIALMLVGAEIMAKST